MATNVSTLTPRQRVIKALSHQQPDRPPFAWNFAFEAPPLLAFNEFLRPHGLNFEQLSAVTNEVRSTKPRYIGPPLPPLKNPWGWTQKPITYGPGQYLEFDHQPLSIATTVEDIRQYLWPNPDDFQVPTRAELEKSDPEHRYAWVFFHGNPMEVFTWLTGLEQIMLWLASEPEMIHAGMERITHIFETIMIRAMEESKGWYDGFYGADDLGGQTSPLMSRDMYRSMIMPYHRHMYATAKRYVRFTIHHSDGSVAGLLDDLIDAGVTCLEAVQVECTDMAPESLKARFGDRLAFQGAVSVQQVLPRLSPDHVRAEVRRLKNVLGRGGGYICGPSHAIQAGTPPANVAAMLEEAVEQPLEQILATARQQAAMQRG